LNIQSLLPKHFTESDIEDVLKKTVDENDNYPSFDDYGFPIDERYAVRALYSAVPKKQSNLHEWEAKMKTLKWKERLKDSM
jgi:hypothetical protein